MFISLEKKQYYMLSQEAKIGFPLSSAMSQLPINTHEWQKLFEFSKAAGITNTQ